MFEELKEHSLAFVLIKDWVPALITIIVGGLFATLLLPRLQGHYAARQALADRRADLAGKAAVGFRRYIMSWRRLRQIAELEAQRALEQRSLDKAEKDRKDEFIAARNAHKDELIETLCYMKAGFSASLAGEIDRFIEWDETQANLRLADLAPLNQWITWEKNLLNLANGEARQG